MNPPDKTPRISARPSAAPHPSPRGKATRYRFGLQPRLMINFILLALVSAALMIVVMFLTARYQLHQSISQRLESMLKIAVLQIDVEEVVGLTDPAQMESNEYLNLQNQMLAIQATSPDIANLYAMRRNAAGEIEFIINTGEDPFKLGEIYKGPSTTLVENFDTMSGLVVEQNFHTGQSGTWLSGYMPLYAQDGERRIILAMDLTAASVLADERQLQLMGLIALILAILVAAVAGWLIGWSIVSPIVKMTDSARRNHGGGLAYQASIQTRDERQELAEEISLMTRRMREMVEGLEERVRERSHEAQTHSLYLEAASEVSQAVTSMVDTEQLTQELVEQIRKSFSMYYVGLFLLDETQTWVVLRAGTGEAGQKMIARGHRRKIGEGMVGWSVANNQARIATEAREDLQRVSASELPDTRSELAIPLRSRGLVIGALTVQSDRYNAFDPQLVTVLQTMADQVAAALDNARLFSESRSVVEALDRANQELNRQTWTALLRQLGAGGRVAFQADESGVQKHSGKQAFELLEGSDSQQGEGPVFSLPVQVRGTTLGYLRVEKPAAAEGVEQSWSREEKTLLQALAEQLGVALENARLYSATQQGAARERIISEITGKVHASTNVDTILKTAAQELALALHLPSTTIQLRPLDRDDQSTS